MAAFVSSTFNTAGSTNIEGSAADVGSTWTQSSAFSQGTVTSGLVSNTNDDASGFRNLQIMPDLNGMVRVRGKLNAAGRAITIYSHATGGDGGVFALSVTETSWTLLAVSTSAVVTTLATGALSLALGTFVKMEMRYSGTAPTTLRAFIDGTEVTDPATPPTSTAATTDGRLGMVGFNIRSSALDWFIAGAVGDADPEGGADTAPPDISSTGTGAINGPFAANCAENSTAAFVTLTANEATTWGALTGTDAALFAKASVTGTTVQLVPVAAFNFEALPHANPFVVTLTATDAAATPNTRTVTVNVTVTNITELPGAPTIGTATAGNASATVAFTAPAAGTAPTVTGFTATSSPGGFTGTGATSPITVNGLANNTAYTFAVTAANSDGTGPASNGSNSVTPAGSGGATLTLADFRLWTGSQIFSVTVPFVKVFRTNNGSLSLELVAQPINAIGTMSFSSSALVAGAVYIAFGFNTDGTQSFKKTVTAS